MHTFKNFKNFAEAEIDLSKPMTLLIGRNGSGKSNLIEGVALLAELTGGRVLNKISDLGRGSDFEIRGGLQKCFQKETKEFEIGFKNTIRFNKRNEELKYSITIYRNDSLLLRDKLMICNESLSVGDKKIFSAELNKGNGILGVEYNNFRQGKNPIEFEPSNGTVLPLSMKYYSMAALGKVLRGSHPLSLDNKTLDEQAFDSIENLIKTLKVVFVFDIYPRLSRNYERIGQSELTKNGSNLSSALYYLQQNSPDILQQILERIKQLPEESFCDFEFITTSVNDVLFALKHEDGSIIDARLLSDGTLRALAILTALETVPEGSRIIIEEIDNGVHASRVNVLIDAIWEASNRRHLNTLITTHNPATLDSLNDEQLECVVVCHYDKQSQSAKLTPFFELPNVDILLQKGKLGGLVTRNVIEHYLDPEFEKQQNKIAAEWLESCQ